MSADVARSSRGHARCRVYRRDEISFLSASSVDERIERAGGADPKTRRRRRRVFGASVSGGREVVGGGGSAAERLQLPPVGQQPRDGGDGKLEADVANAWKVGKLDGPRSFGEPFAPLQDTHNAWGEWEEWDMWGQRG